MFSDSLFTGINCAVWSSHRTCFFFKKVFLKISQNSHEYTCARVSILIKLQAWGLRPATLLVTLAQAFSCKFCEISKNRFSCRTTPVAVSVHYNKKTRQCRECQKFYLPNLQIKRNLQYLLAIEMFLKVKYSFDLISIKCNIQRKRSRDWSSIVLNS